MARRWRVHPHDPDRVASLSRSAQVPAIVAQLLLCRGIEHPDAAKLFLEPRLDGLRDPHDLPGVLDAVELLHATITAGERIVIYGDYDADGMTSTAILGRCFRQLDANFTFYVPHRIDEGYGLNSDALRKLAKDGAKLVITVDCGIASVAEADVAKELGLKLIITDHHTMADTLPAADVLVHPKLPGTDYPFPGLCGAGVALKVAWALCRKVTGSKRVRPDLQKYLLQAVGLAAIGTVADVVPLIDENRVLVHAALSRALPAEACPGLRALMKAAGIDKKPQLDGDDIAFMLAPRLNAAGRMGQAELAIELLLTEDEKRAEELANYLCELNEQRQHVERTILRAAKKQAREEYDPQADAALVLAGRGWHAGVIGVVAGRIAETFHRPTFVIALDELGVKPGTGSGRSAGGLDLHGALQACDEHLLKHGGHSAAAGLSIEEGKIDAFRKAFCEFAAANLSEEDREAEIWIDAEAPLAGLTLKTVEQIQRLSPFGMGNARPFLCACDVSLAEAPRTMGKNDAHLAVKLSQHDIEFRAVAFGSGHWAEEMAAVKGTLDVVFRPVINHFGGRRNVELHLQDWRPSESGDSPAPTDNAAVSSAG